MPFIKGHKINIGRICSKETRDKISTANSGRIRNQEIRKKLSENNSRFWLGKKRPPHTEESKKKISESKTGIPNLKQRGQKRKYRGELHHFWGKQNFGENNPNYFKDRSLLKRFNDDSKDRRSSAYVTWRRNIWLRDSFKCRINDKECKGRIEAHHILSYKDFPELRYKINNGITLCHAHHPRKRAEEKRLIPYFQGLVSVSNESN